MCERYVGSSAQNSCFLCLHLLMRRNSLDPALRELENKSVLTSIRRLLLVLYTRIKKKEN